MADEDAADQGVAERVLGLLTGLLPPGTEITLDSDLPRLGMSSLTMTRLWFGLRKELGVDIETRRLAGCPTPRDLVARVAEARRATGAVREEPVGPAAPGADPAARHEPFPLTDLQQSYLIGKLSGDPAGCHVYREFEIADLDPARMAAAWRRVVAHHDALRMVLTPDGRQRIREETPPVDVPVHDFTGHGSDPGSGGRGADAYAERVRSVRERLSHRTYEAGVWPMHAVEITRGPDGRGTVHLSIDAALTDGHGLSVLLDDWWRWYTDPERAAPPRPELSVRDCLAELAAERRTPEYADHLAYWTGRLADLPGGPMDATAPDGARRTCLSGRLDGDQWRIVRELAVRWEVTPTALVLTLFAEAFAWQRDSRPFSLVLTTNDRVRLPAEAEAVVGPFTSSLVMPLPRTLDRPLPEAVRAVQRRLWDDLAHSVVSGVSALRQAKARDVSLPVVFTSMLDIGRPPEGLAALVTHAVSQTSGVALDHQMWEQDGELRFRWDVVEEAFPPGAVREVFARFCATLHDLTPAEPEPRPLNELQQAYFVTRAVTGPAPWDGCQVYHSFVVDGLDPARLESAWLRLVAAYDVLRTVVGHDGRLHVSPHVPARREIPVVDGVDPERLVGRAFPLGRGPQSDLRITNDADGTATVHCVLDLTIIDGRSIHFLVRELWRLYDDPAAEPLPVASYADHLAERAAADAGERDIEHWRGRVDGVRGGPLPPAPEGSSPRRVRHAGEVTGWRAVRAAALRAGITPDGLLASALTEVLARRHPVPFSIPVVRWTGATQRFRPGEYTALSWVTRTEADVPVWRQAAEFHRILAEDTAADSVSGLAALRKRVMRERRTGQFDLAVVYTGLLDLTAQPLPPGVRLGPWLTCTPDVSLDCIAIEEGDLLRFYWDAVGSHFPSGSLERMFAEYAELVRGLCDEAEAPVPAHRDDLAHRGDAVHRDDLAQCGDVVPGGLRAGDAVPAEWNDTAVDFPDDRPVHALFEEQVRLRPDAVAVRWAGGGALTYAELNRRANRIAWSLREHGVGPEVAVGISVPRGPHMVAAVFGVLKAGGCYVPVEPSLPQARAEAILNDAGIGLVLTAAGRTGWDVPGSVLSVPIDTLTTPDSAPEPLGGVDDTAYVIFTSGSTGKPKGVAVTHRPVLNLLNWCYRTHGFGPGDVGLCVTSLGFDLSVFDILGLLGCGAGLYVADEVEQKDPHLLLDILLSEPVTFWNSAPTTLNQMAPLFASRIGDSGAATLRLVYLSGDYTPLPLPDEVRALFREARIVSLGGATEATVWSNWYEVGEIDPAWRSIPYGRPIDNARYHILDEDMRPCPVGTEGDLYIGGDCLAVGYHRQPELTRERFIPDPFSDRPGDRLYRTGDRASYFPSGDICFLGRADDQVKIRGFRVEPGEIEHRLREHPGVKDVVVMARPDPAGDRRLVAYAVPAGAGLPSVSELRRFAARSLPDYMVPNVIAFVDVFPATNNGKLDRDALPWPVEPGSRHILAPAPVAPPSPPLSGSPSDLDSAPPPGTVPNSPPDADRLAGQIADAFAEILGLSAVDVEADVWDQGATSFTMVQVSTVLQQRYGRRVPVSALLDHPTVLGIATALAADLAAEHAADEGRVESAGGSGEPPSAGAVDSPAPALEAPALEDVPWKGAAREDVPWKGAAREEPVLEGSAQEETVREGIAGRPAPVDFFSAAERAAFKKARWDLRPMRPGETATLLDDVPTRPETVVARASRRTFDRRPIPYADFARFLGLLREVEVDGRPRRRYPSAGDTYAVQVYLRVGPGAVAGLAEGLYYYHPVDHALHLVNPAPVIDRRIHFVYNRPVFDQAGVELYLFGRAAAIEPLYGADSERFLLLEAGYLGQELMREQEACGIGLCPIGTLDIGPVREQLGLDDDHLYLHAFLAGPVPGEEPASQREPASRQRPESRVEAVRIPTPGTAGAPTGEIAVIGMACRFPGADDPDAFWRELSHGISRLTPPPEHRHALADPELVGGFLTDVDEFDSLLFHVSPADAATIDPQLRLLLHVVWECLENAGHTAVSLNRAGRVGVFLGAMWQDHQHVGADRWRRGEPAAVSATASEAANRISHFFGFTGPSLAVDTSCSSSLAALHLAAESLRRGECEAAVVAAANLLGHPYHHRLLADLGLLATGVPEGAFDAAAPGWIPGEGVAAIVLRPVSDGDSVHAILEATRIGHLGGHGRFGTPDAAALTRSMADTLAAAGVTAATTGYVECAAAGAALADAAELEALHAVFAGAPVRLGTVKPNIGHLEAAAGLSQLIKVLLQMRHRQLAPTLVAADPSPLVRGLMRGLVGQDGAASADNGADGAGMEVADRLTHWTPPAPGAPLRALINSVGATGSYGHALLRSPDPDRADQGDEQGEQAVTLSAESPEQLRELAGRLHDHLVERQRRRALPALADIAYTLWTGRAQLRHRLVITCSDVHGLLAGLRAYRDGSDHSALATGTAVTGAATVVPGTLPEATAAWLAGHPVEWSGARGRRVALPTYPFASLPTPPEPVPNPAAPGTGPAASPLPGRAPLAARPPSAAGGSKRMGRTEEYLVGLYAEISGIPADRIDPRVPLENYGLTSLQIVQLNERLRRDLGEVSTTLFFEHPHLAGVADALARAPVAVREGEPVAGEYRPREEGPIAIIGVAGRYPEAGDLEEFWRNLVAGRDAITPLPESRRRPGWPVADMVGGFLRDVEAFDPLFFGITPRDAALMDPAERLFLQVAWHALEDAGLTGERLRLRHAGQVGVFVGAMYNEYPFFGPEQARRGEQWTAAGSAIAGIANRVSYLLDLHGPSMTVDTMCSASLTALHLAVTSLRGGECELALVGGVNLSLHPNKFLQLRQMSMSATDHRCRSFGAGGDGFVPGEAVGAVLLKPLDRAIADGNRVQAVILGTAVNHDGKTNGYTVPNPVLQGELVTRALRDAGVSPETIGYLEAHGTGTPLGDPIEINGLTRAFASAGLPPGACAIGSVKSLIGHCEAAAGIAGLTKVILQFRHGTLAPSIHADRLNPGIDWDRVPFRVQREAAPWPADLPRRAGISSFGAGGANAHVVVEAYPEPEPGAGAVPTAGPHLIVLSARTEEQLRQVCVRLAGHLRDNPGLALADVAHTLQTGREALKERLAVVVTDRAELCEVLERYASGGEAEGWRGRADGRAVRAGEPLRYGQAAPAELGRHWVAGGAVDFTGAPGRLVGLPGYPFARMRCWVGEPPAAMSPVAESPAAVSPTSVSPAPTSPAPTSPAVVSAASSRSDAPGAAVPLLVRDWRPAPAGAPREPDGGTILCLHRPAQRALVDALAEALAPDRLVPMVEGAAGGLDGSGLDGSGLDGSGLDGSGLDRGGTVTGWLDLCALPDPRAPEADAGRLDPAAAEEHDHGAWGARLEVLQQLLARRHRAGVRVMQVTSGLLDAPGPRPRLAGARLAGFVRCLGAEYPWVHANVLDVDLPTDRVTELAAWIAEAWRTRHPHGEVCLRDGLFHTPRLVPAPEPAEPAEPLSVDPERVYVVTGGTGGLGTLVAGHLVKRGARRLALLGLRPLPPRYEWARLDPAVPEAATVARVQELERLGARVMVHTGQITDGPAVGRFLDDVRASLGPIAGVVHCAGRSSIGPPSLRHKNLAEIRQVLAPKTDGLDTLIDLLAADRPDFVLLFSSVSAAVPALATGLSDYAAANAYLDYRAAYQVRTGHPEFRSVDWPVWRETGGGTDRPDAGAIVGLDALTDTAGLAVLDRVLALRGVPVVLPWPALPSSALPGGFDPGTAPATDQPTGRPAGRPADPRPAEAGPVAGWLVTLFAETLGIPEAELDTDTAFGDLGVESVLLAELVGKLEARLGRPLEPAVLLDHPTLNRLDAHLAGLGDAIGAATEAARPTPSVRSGENRSGDDRIAVIGMGCRFPGAGDLAAYWDLLRSGRSAITEVPYARWDVAARYRPLGGPGHSVSKWGGFLPEIEDFDPEYFGMTDDEARNTDPAIRLMLEVTASCLADAGYVPEELRGRDVGVFVGARMSGYRRRIPSDRAATGLGGDQNFIAARLAHQYDLHGPNLVVDSACSSSLVSVHLACQSLLAGEAELAFAGGVEVLLDEEPYVEFTAARALSPTGRCAAFARDADGFVPGEGCGVVLLKRLDHAVRDGDRIHAVIDAVAVGNDGQTMGLTTPNPAAQAQVVRRALERAGLRADRIGLVEAHGTGTMIGDPIELRALTDVFREQTDRVGFCAIGSVKSNLGHLLSAAGAAGLIKVLLALEQGLIPATLHCAEPNPRFDFAASPFYPNTRALDWPDGPRAAGVSAFGLGGTNAHLIATAFDVPRPRRRTALPAPVFHRRRLWWDREPAPRFADRPRGGGPNGDREGNGLVASILDLRFE
ncbi:amino acid adenylation domain-containing protein [Sphaerimonospora sp. CA-214678]|uniref:amino acid adenylation domain-containing protein n=1 Tax=Sphaerimonospora sp. CA-214678 TaxID=3240029 RepID=UPI003D93ABAA